MEDKQNIFYSSISKYYSDIFPYKPVQLKFVDNKLAGLREQRILDIGCATGELAFQLAESGADVIGIDLNEDLLAQTGSGGFQSASKNSGWETAETNPKFRKGNMLELTSDFRAGEFDAILCFGNTLVHLQSEDLVAKMLREVFTVLKPGGQFLLQILNYDHIIKNQICELPLLETTQIKFIRNYKFTEGSELIGFHTELEIKAENLTVSNETPLLALKSKQLQTLLQEAGFENIQLYANFKQDLFGGTHLPLVASCTKL